MTDSATSVPATTNTEPEEPTGDKRLRTLHDIIHRLITLAHVSDDERRDLHTDLATILDPNAPTAEQVRNQQEIHAKKLQLEELQRQLTELEGQ